MNDKLYIIGGMDNKCLNQFNCSDDILIYDLSNNDIYKLFYRKIALAESEESINLK